MNSETPSYIFWTEFNQTQSLVFNPQQKKLIDYFLNLYQINFHDFLTELINEKMESLVNKLNSHDKNKTKKTGFIE